MSLPSPDRSISSTGAWQLRDELAFIDGLGSWRDHDASVTVADKLALLASYRAGLLLRVRWDNLQQEPLLLHVDATIQRFSKLKPDATVF